MADALVHSWQMTAVGEPVVANDFEMADPPEGEARVAVAGCGVCHTDISFLQFGVPTRMKPPLVLGHEISGTVDAVGEGVDGALLGQPVLIPAVLPCGTCDLCVAGRRRICRNQIMPGNDRHGGFASHVTVPARFLCRVPDEVLAAHDLWELSVVSDAVTTPFQAVRRAGLEKGDTAIVIGAGGIGIHAVQIAAAVGAKVVVLDIDDKKLEQASGCGAAGVVNVSGLDGKEVKGAVKALVKQVGGAKFCSKVFETSGTKAGQMTGFNLLGLGGTMAVVGFTMDKLEVRLSNLMAFDADIFGIWGCDPMLYPEVLSWIAEGRIELKQFVEQHPLDDINAVLDDAHHGRLEKRAVLVP